MEGMIFPAGPRPGPGPRGQYSYRTYDQRPDFFKLFSQPNPTSYSQVTSSPLKSLAAKGVGGLTKTLDNVQNVLNVVESTAPMIQKYGPIIKNIPAMYKMMKAIHASDDDENDKDEREVEDKKAESQDAGGTDDTDDHDIEDESEPSKTSKTIKKESGVSTPKLFI